MAKTLTPVFRQRIFEARYEKGYRYLDHCGEVMLILEDLLSEHTGALWFSKDASPTAARLICPNQDLTLVFSSSNLIVDQQLSGESHLAFKEICTLSLSTVIGRLGLEQFKRFGARQIWILPANDISNAEQLSLKFYDQAGAPELPESFHPRHCETDTVYELDDRSKGVKVEIKPISKWGTPLEIDERLKLPPHHLPDHQREALLEQLKRNRQQKVDPEAGLSIDIDYYWMWPKGRPSSLDFLKEADEVILKTRDSVLGRGRQS